MPAFRACFLLLLLSAMARPAFAWGETGHRIVADLATVQLRPRARAEADRLLAGLPDPTLAGVANWADQLREAGGELAERSRPWHYIGFKSGRCVFEPARDCADGKCVVSAINHNLTTLSDRTRTDEDRRDALRFLVHFVGDVHQPLHASPLSDKGGNDYQIAYRGEGSNLHAVWDRIILRSGNASEAREVESLSRRPPLPPDPTSGSDRPAVEWALESCRLATTVYPPGHVISDQYLQAWLPLVELRLRRAGSRLARLLNAALDPLPSRPTP